MATYYWGNGGTSGTGTWNAASITNWWTDVSRTTAATVAPTSADDVIIDSSSGTGTITCTAAVCNNITVTATQAITIGATSTLSVFGDLTFPSGGSFSVTAGSTITFAATTTGKTITTNGKSISNIIFNGVGGGWTLGDALFCNIITFTNGTFDTSSTNNYSLSAGAYNLGAGTKTINFNASTVTGGGNQVINFLTNATGLTFNAGTSTINISGPTPTVQGNGNTFYNVSFTNTVTAVMTGANIFNNLTFTSRTTDGISTWSIDSNQTVNGTLTLGASNTAVRRIFLFSSAVGTQRTITATTVATLSDVDFRAISFSASQSGTRLGDCGGNNNITFDAGKTVYWNLAGSQNWSAIGWATGSGGTPDVNNFPLAQDTVVIDNTSAGSTITINSTWNIGTFDASLRTSALTTTFSAAPNCYLNWITGTGLTYSGTSTLTFAGRTTQQLTSAGKAFTNGITVNGTTTNSLVLQDAFTTASTQSVSVTQGTLNLNNFTLTCGFLSSGTGLTRTIAFGTGAIYVTGNNSIVVNLALAAGLSITGSANTYWTYSGSVGTRSYNYGGGTTESQVVNCYVTAGSDTLLISGKTIDLTGFSGTLSNSTRIIWGDLKIPSGVTVSAGALLTTFQSASAIHKLTTSGITLDFPITVGTAGSTNTLQLQDDLTMGSTRTLTFTAGTFDANNYNVTTGLFSSSNSNIRTLKMGSGTWTLTGTGTVWNTNTNTNLTLNAGTSTLNFNASTAKTSFLGTGLTYYNVANIGLGVLTISNSSIYNNLSCIAGSGLTFGSGTTQQANTYTLVGTPSSIITLAPTSTTNYTLTKLGGGAFAGNFLNISRMTASPTFYAFNSVNSGNNSNVNFNTPGTYSRLSNTGILFVPPASTIFDEVSQTTISASQLAFYAEEFDEVTNPGVSGRYLNNGIVQTQGIIDEITGIS